RCTSLTTRFVSCRSPAPPYPYPLSLHDALPFSYQGAVLTPDPQFVELTDLRWIRGTAGVDQVLERLGGQIHHELPGGFHIDQGILAPHRCELHDRGIDAGDGEERVWGQVVHALGRGGGDPGDGPGEDQGRHQVVGRGDPVLQGGEETPFS